jgi:FMN-dependent NADH-azoreductase
MNILHISSSPRGAASESHRLSRRIVDCLVQRDPSATVVSRMLGGRDIPHVDADYAISQQSLVDGPDSDGTMALSEELIGELAGADVLVIGTPMHNYAVPSALKAWIDHVVRVRWTFNVTPAGKRPAVRDRPVYVAISSGGRFLGDHARQPDFLTPYLKTILGMIGLEDLTFFTIQGTAFGPDALAESRARVDRALLDHFAATPVHDMKPGDGDDRRPDFHPAT